MSEKKELVELEDDVREAVLNALGNLAEDMDFPLSTIQPPESVLEAAAHAATQVFIAFERGFRMNQEQEG